MSARPLTSLLVAALLALAPHAALADAAPAPLTLAEASGLAQRHQLAIEAARARLRAAEADQAAAGDDRWPTLSVAGTARYDRLPAESPLRTLYGMPGGQGLVGFPADGAALDASIAVQQTFFDGFRRQDREAIAAGSRKLAALALQHERNQAALAVGLAYFQALAAQEAARAAEATLDQAQAHVRLEGLRVAAGTGTQAALLARQALLARSEGELVARRNAAGLARLELERATGVTLGERPLAGAALAPLELDVEQELAAGLPRRTETQQRATERGIAQAQLALAEHGRWPSLTGSAALAQRNMEPATFTSGLTVGWQAFDGFRSRDAIAGARARLEAAEAALGATRRDLELEVRRQVQLRQEARDRQAIAARGLAAAREAYRTAYARYAAGFGLDAELSDARAALAGATDDHRRATFDAAAAALRLAAALDLDLPTYLSKAAPAADRP